ncbi:MAG: lytic transglycosylase domain-containing protein [Anaeromyxobacteraceae bacterium]
MRAVKRTATRRTSWQRRWRRLASRWRASPAALRAPFVLGLLFAVTVGYQVLRKPTELFAVVPTASKGPPSTWSAYGPLFREHATELVTPELLAALSQVESAGDPLARTYWRWRWAWNPLGLYGPASSAVGLLQITDGTYAEARHLCVHDHRVVRDGPWRDPRVCWFNDLYVRWLPSHAIEMTSAWLDVQLRSTLGARLERTSPERRCRLAAVIHLCGPRRGAAYARRGFRTLPRERCGDHRLEAYLARVGELAEEFARLAREAG